MNAVHLIRENKKKAIALAALVLTLFVALGVMVNLSWAPVSWGWGGPYSNVDGVAIQGYDVVAYHAESKAVRGTPANTHEHRGVKWFFASAENRAAFAADPQKFLPAYGGFCSTGIRLGFTFPAEPDAFVVRDGRLYLFAGQSPKADFVAALPGSKATADKNWRRR